MSDLIIRLGLWLARQGMKHKRYPDERLPYVVWETEGDQREWEIEVADDGTVIETETTTSVRFVEGPDRA